jgi:two-component system alkaline phosphatase synthesis response regulator PhoP
MKKILVVEDDPAISKGLIENLEQEHYKVVSADDGEKGYKMAKRENPDLIILDIMLPSKNGYEICQDLRKESIATPIIMLTGKGEEADKVLGLELGADDYVTKPFSIRELLARVRAVLRRKFEAEHDISEYSFGDVHLDFKKMEATKGKKQLKVSAKEFEILKFFAKREGQVITRNAFLDEVWGYEVYPTTRTVDNYILSVRKKIEDNPSRPKHLLTVHTAGYKFIK